MADSITAAAFLPDSPTLERLAEAANGCTACPLYQDATQAVLGQGPQNAKLILVGEQPGDKEDRAGAPFVGPAGKKLDDALEAAGVDRSRVYVTNAVKHFKHEKRGKNRLHKKPNAYEIEVCKPWLAAEIDLVQPGCLVALGATAARSLLGKSTSISKARNQELETEYGLTVVTYHPSAALRHPYESERARIFDALVEDLHRAWELAGR